MPSIRTLADIDNGHYSVHAHCNLCRHHRELSLASLIEKLGADFELAEMRLRARCSACSARAPDVVVHTNHDGRVD